MQARGLCRELLLDFLSREEIDRYLALEFPEHQFPDDLPALIHARTEGNPLFLADLVRYLRDRKVIAKIDRLLLKTGQQARRAKNGPQLKSRGFDRTYSKKFDGTVVKR